MKLKQFGLYDLKDCEQLVYLGTKKEIAEFLGLTVNYLSIYLVRKKKGIKHLIKHKYDLVELKGE